MQKIDRRMFFNLLKNLPRTIFYIILLQKINNGV